MQTEVSDDLLTALEGRVVLVNHEQKEARVNPHLDWASCRSTGEILWVLWTITGALQELKLRHGYTIT